MQPAFATGAIFARSTSRRSPASSSAGRCPWQEGFGHGALASGLVVSPFALGAIVTARKSHAIAQRLGRWILILGCSMVAAGLTSLLLVFHLSGQPSPWYVVGPLLLAGLGAALATASRPHWPSTSG